MNQFGSKLSKILKKMVIPIHILHKCGGEAGKVDRVGVVTPNWEPPGSGADTPSMQARCA